MKKINKYVRMHYVTKNSLYGGVFMQYERKIEESREYEYGPGKEFEVESEAQKNVNHLRNEILTNLIIQGFRTSIEEMKVIKVEGKNAFKLRVVIKYPIQIFEE